MDVLLVVEGKLLGESGLALGMVVALQVCSSEGGGEERKEVKPMLGVEGWSRRVVIVCSGGRGGRAR